MSTILMNSESSNNFYTHRPELNRADKTDLRRGDKLITLSDLVSNTHRIIEKKRNRNNEFKISETIWDEELELPDGY